MTDQRIIVAIDTYDRTLANAILDQLNPALCMIKIGSVVFNALGKSFLHTVSERGFKIFLDLKLHDIPNTVEKGLNALKRIKPILTTIHISGGDKMMESAARIKKNTKILGVSILTSMDSKQTQKYYNKKDISKLVKKFAIAAKNNKLDGVVCSPKEIKYIRKETGNNFIIVTPGIRVDDKIKGDDQKRIETPRKAIDAGANYLVIGRPITESTNPLKVLKEINKTLF